MALAWSAAIERKSPALRQHRAWHGARAFHSGGRLAYAHDLDLTATLPYRGLFVDPVTGASLLGGGAEFTARSTADVALLGLMRGTGQFRFRSFYLDAGGERGAVTLGVHQRADPAVPAPLAVGACVADSLAGRTPLVVPELLDFGTSTLGDRSSSATVDWVVETALDAHPVAAEEVTATIHELIELLAETWSRSGVEHVAMAAPDRAVISGVFAELVVEPHPGAWPADLDPAQIGRRVEKLLDEPRPLTVGISHGDPGLGNVLRMSDGRLALVDWEDAGRRPVAHDVIKAALSAPDPVDVIDRHRLSAAVSRSIAADAAAWDRQLAIALVTFMKGWKHRYARALGRRSVVAHTQRMHRQLRLLDHLLG